MEISLCRKIYPMEFLSIAENDFVDELLIEVKELSETNYTISINAPSDQAKLSDLVGSFLNRFLEVCIVGRFN